MKSESRPSEEQEYCALIDEDSFETLFQWNYFYPVFVTLAQGSGQMRFRLSLLFINELNIQVIINS